MGVLVDENDFYNVNPFHNTYDHNIRSKFHKKLIVRGAGGLSAYGQPDRKISPKSVRQIKRIQHLFSENLIKINEKKLRCQIVGFILLVPNCLGAKLSVFTMLVPNCPYS